jgi:hypothetical protein
MADSLPTVPVSASAPPSRRDLRLDVFRGLALWFIFLDHMPSNTLNAFTIGNIGFSDASEIFVFISGFAAAVAYGSILKRRGYVLAVARILRRVWQLYVAHIFLFVAFIAQVAYVAARFQNPMFAEEMGIVQYFSEPHVSLLQALLLKFRPANLDILPLYIVLLASFPAVLWGIARAPLVTLAVSAAAYVVVRYFHLNLPGHPPGTDWYFNPLAWQLLFVTGAVFGMAGDRARRYLPPPKILLPIAILYLVFAFMVAKTWVVPAFEAIMPNWLGDVLYPIDKTNLDILRYTHFLAMAYVTVTLVRSDARLLRWRLLNPLLVCGQHSLQVFCVGVFLSFAGHWILVQFNGGLGMQVAVSASGIALMCALAYVLAWYKRKEGARTPAVAATPSSAPSRETKPDRRHRVGAAE